VFAVTVSVNEPGPVRPDPEPSVNHPADSVTLHVHWLPVVTVTVVVDAALLRVSDEGATVYVHGVPACVTVNVLPAIVSVPVLDVGPVFSSTS
jgi:hypothetical protein